MDILEKIKKDFSKFDTPFLFYIISRLFPFIIICFFVIQSMVKSDLKGVIYLAGVIFACTVNILFGSFPGLQEIPKDSKIPTGRYHMCRLIEFTGGPMSYLPLGITILSFTMIYLIYNAVTYNLIFNNGLMILFLSVLIVNDFYYNFTKGCAKIESLVLSLAIGMLTGTFWGYIINTIGDPRLQLISGTNPNMSCYTTNSKKYKCKAKK